MFCNPKPQKTIPQEFHFATEDRLGPPATVVEIFDKVDIRMIFSIYHVEGKP